MSEADNAGGSSSITPEAIPAVPDSHQAPPLAIAQVRTLQDVQRDDKQDALSDQAVAKLEVALSAHDAALPASDNDAKESRDSDKSLTVDGARAQHLADSQAERAELQAAANASSEQKSKFLIYTVLRCTFAALTASFV